jgi:hypothetical protein
MTDTRAAASLGQGRLGETTAFAETVRVIRFVGIGLDFAIQRIGRQKSVCFTIWVDWER